MINSQIAQNFQQIFKFVVFSFFPQIVFAFLHPISTVLTVASCAALWMIGFCFTLLIH